MNSYPPELLAQLAPVMFVAGLDFPTVPATPVSPAATISNSPQDPFLVLTQRLRDALQAQRKAVLWQPDKKTFQIVLADKDAKFPPRKLVPPEDPQYSNAHSPLSPLTPSSPLHPDGLIAPIWIRKHTTLVPSVFVLFLRIYETPQQQPKSPLDISNSDHEREREQEERRRDMELAADVALRKKSTTERGIKLTVVLMASRRMLDDPTLDSRLTFIRRQSGLDSRAALFVLSPVSPSELSDFVKSLQQALYEPALEYYTAHSKRVRRKRNRHSQAVSSYPTPTTGNLNIARPLRPEGWTVRYEYKMACFAEFRGEDEVALKHYQDAYAMLVIMFGSTATLPPRTKRWAEAKVLADCINIKVIKLYLYNNEYSLALSHHNTHMRKFGDFSRGWGIGEETFEFWSWMARQHRILAELLEQGTRSTLTIPTHKPLLNSSFQSTTPPPKGTIMEADALRTLGINPSHALQHPGFYYYMAARCTELRRERFLTAMELELSQQPVALSPGYTNEKKVEHWNIILELYTKSYELFKKYTPPDLQNQSKPARLPMWIARRAAQTHFDSGNFDSAIKFFDRIAKVYREEKWESMLRPLLYTWYACARRLEDVELSVRLLIEMLGYDPPDSEDPNSLEEDLIAIMETTVPANGTVIIDPPESQPIFDSSVVFWTPEVKVGESVAFQLCLTAPTSISLSSIPFDALEIYFSHSELPVVIRHTSSDSESQSLVQKVDLGNFKTRMEEHPDIRADLRWRLGSTIVFSGTISSDVPCVLKIKKLVLSVVKNSWRIEIPSNPCSFRQSSHVNGKWLTCLEPPRFLSIKREGYFSTIVKHRPHGIVVSLSHFAPAYLDEEYPIIIQVTNLDDRDMDIAADVLLQPSEIDGAANSIILDGEQSSSLIKGIHLGILSPGSSVSKTLHLISTGAAGNRMLDISVQSRTNLAALKDEELDPESADVMETLQTLIVSTVNPISVTHDVLYRRALRDCVGLADLKSYDDEFWNVGGDEAIVNLKLEYTGPWSLDIESITLEKKDNPHARIVESSTDLDDDIYPDEYLPGDVTSHFCSISLVGTDEHGEMLQSISAPGYYIVKWRRILSNGDRGTSSTSLISLPSLRPPADGLVALLSAPPMAKLHTPILLTLSIRNRHPSRSANVSVSLEQDTLDAFIISGMRSGRVPVLLPGTEETIVWKAIPIECGYIKIPRIKVLDRRKAIAITPGAGTSDTTAEQSADYDVVQVIDVRFDQRRVQENLDASNEESNNGHDHQDSRTILVLA